MFTVRMTAVVVEGLVKRYGAVEAVRGASLSVETGEIFALLGPNGAGKTTALEILEGFRQRDDGHVEVLGLDPGERSNARRLREQIGLVLQDIAVEPYLKVRETVARNAGYYPAPRDVDEVIERVGLAGKEAQKVKDLSGGQRRRLDLALGIVGNPRLLFLDEPTTGFDPNARQEAWQGIRDLRDTGTTILLTTHYMDEAQALADRVAVIASGRIVAEGTPSTIGGRDTARTRIRFGLPESTVAEDLPIKVEPRDGLVAVEVDEPTEVLHLLTGWALERGVTLARLTVERPSPGGDLPAAHRRAGPGRGSCPTASPALLAERLMSASVRRRNDLALVAHQVRYEQLSFWRNPQSAFFTFIFPVVIIVIFGAVFNTREKDTFYFGLTGLQYYIPTIAALSVLGACYTQLAIGLAFRRQTGILKRVRATPLPAWAYFVGLLAHCVILSAIDIAIIVVVGSMYDVPLPSHWTALVITLVLGAASFCALGVAVASLVTDAEAAPAVVQFILFPLVFISGTYFPIHSSVLNGIADALPVRPFNEALIGPFARHTGFDWDHLAVLLAWGVVGALVAIRRFRWDPRPE